MIRVGSLISQQCERRSGLVSCSFSSSSDGNGSMAENFSESDEDYVNSSVIEADGQPCLETKEFDLVRNMLLAAVEECYRDAAQWREKITQLHAKRKNWA